MLTLSAHIVRRECRLLRAQSGQERCYCLRIKTLKERYRSLGEDLQDAHMIMRNGALVTSTNTMNYLSLIGLLRA